MEQTKLVLGFVAGAAIGAAATWKLLHDKHEQRIKEEIASIRKSLTTMPKAEMTEETNREEDSIKTAVRTYRSMANKYRSMASEPEASVNDSETTQENDEPYVITPDEFATLDGYSVISLTYFADNVLCDDQLAVIENVEATVGPDAIDSIGMYDENAIHVRNDRLKVDYEILQDLRNYRDILEDRPYLNQ